MDVFGRKLNIAVRNVTCTLKIDRQTGKPFKSFLISAYPKERNAAHLRKWIEENGMTKIVYREPYFWKVYA